MKLPLIGVVVGLILGIPAVIWLGPETAGGTALVLLMAVLLATLVTLVASRFILPAAAPATPKAKPRARKRKGG